MVKLDEYVFWLCIFFNIDMQIFGEIINWLEKVGGYVLLCE